MSHPIAFFVTSQVPRMVEQVRAGRKPSPVGQPPVTPPLVATRLVVTPGNTLTISKNGQAMVYAWATDNAGTVVPGVDINFASSHSRIVVNEVTTDARTDLVRARLTSLTDVGTANITVSSSGLPSIVVAGTVQNIGYGQSGGGKPVGYHMTNYSNASGIAAMIAYCVAQGQNVIQHNAVHENNATLNIMALLDACANAGIKCILQTAGQHYICEDSSGTFQLSRWTNYWDALLAKYPSIDTYVCHPGNPTAPWVLHYVIDEPTWTGSWGPNPPGWANVRTIAAASKAALPNLETCVRERANKAKSEIGAGGANYFSRANLDRAWFQYLVKQGSVSTLLQQDIDASVYLGLLPVVGSLNVTGGGAGSPRTGAAWATGFCSDKVAHPGVAVPGRTWSNIGDPDAQNRCHMTGAEIEHYGDHLCLNPNVWGMLQWWWDDTPNAVTNYHQTTEIQTALKNVAQRYSTSSSGDPTATLTVPGTAGVGEDVTIQAAGTNPLGGGYVMFIRAGDGSPLYGPISQGSQIPVLRYDTAGTYTVVLEVVTPSGQRATDTADITISGVSSGYYTNTAPLAPPAVPSGVAKGSSYVNDFGHRVFYLISDGVAASAQAPALNYDNSRIAYVRASDGAVVVADVAWTATTGVVTNVRAVTALAGILGDGLQWARSSPNKDRLYWLRNSGTILQLYYTDVSTGAATLVKDIGADSVWTGQMGAGPWSVGTLRSSRDQTGFVFYGRAGLTTGTRYVCYWSSGSGLKFFNRPVAGSSLSDEERTWPTFVVAKDGSYIAIFAEQATASDPASYNDSWQPIAIPAGTRGTHVTDGVPPAHGDSTATQVYAAPQPELRRWTFSPAQSPGTVVYSFPLLTGKGALFVDYEVSRVDEGTRSTVASQEHDAAGLAGPLALHSGSIYKVTWATEVAAKSFRNAPTEVWEGTTILTKATAVAAMTPGSWYFDGTTLYLWAVGSGIPVLTGAGAISARDWRFGHNEIFLVNDAGTLLGRVGHTNDRQVPGTIGQRINANVSYDGSRIVFNSNWGGGGNRIMAVLTTPG